MYICYSVLPNWMPIFLVYFSLFVKNIMFVMHFMHLIHFVYVVKLILRLKGTVQRILTGVNTVSPSGKGVGMHPN
jgi:hypothetical protein